MSTGLDINSLPSYDKLPGSRRFDYIHPHPKNRVISIEEIALLVNPETGNWLRLSESGYRLYQLLSKQTGRSGVTDDAHLLDRISTAQVEAFVKSLRDGRFVIETDEPSDTRSPVADRSNSKAAGYCGARGGSLEGALQSSLLNVTNRCNLRCEHCAVYMEEDGRVSSHNAVVSRLFQIEPAKRESDDAARDYPFERIVELIDRLADRGVRNLVLFGGEPLLRRDIKEIIRYASSRVPNVGLATNGTLLSPAISRVIAEHVSDVRVSLDGSRPEVHDPIRGPKAFERTLQGIRTLRSAGFNKIHIKTVITRKNVLDIPNLVKLARKLKVDLELNIFLPLGRGCVARDELQVDADHLLQAFKNVWLLADFYGLESASFNAICNKWIGRAADNCGAGCGCVLADCSGDLYPCEALQYSSLRMGNLIEDRLVQIRPLTSTFDRSVDSLADCSRCEVRYFCSGGCAAEAFVAGSRQYTGSALCAFYRAVLPRIAARWERNLSSWQNLKRVFGDEIDFSQAKGFLSA